MPLLDSKQKLAAAGKEDQEFEEYYEEVEMEEALDEEEDGVVVVVEEEEEGGDAEEVVEEEEDEEGGDAEEVVEEEEEGGDAEEVVEEEELSGEEEDNIDVQEELVEESVKKSAIDEVKSSTPTQQAVPEVSCSLPPASISPFLKSVNDLEKVHRALTEFFRQLHSLNRSLDVITADIDAQTRQGAAFREQEKNERNRLQITCDSMGGKALRKHIETNISEVEGLRRDVPEALRRTPNPAKLVLEAVGRFYTQGSKAYKNNTGLVLYRRGCILLLEFYVLSGCISEDSSVKEEAKAAAVSWWSRLINESIEAASMEDSLGLILFIACFGIPQVFGFKELCHLLRKSNLKKKADVLRCSSILVEKIPSIIKELIREEMYVEAADLSCYFGLKDSFPPLPLLSTFLANVAKVTKVGKEDQQGHSSERSLKESNMWKLASLKSVAKCLEDHKLDSRELSSKLIYQKIAKLEKDIAKEEVKSPVVSGKRKIEDTAASKKSKSKFKKPLHSTSEASHSIPSQMNKDKSGQGTVQPQFPDYKGVLFHGAVENSSFPAAGAIPANGTTTGPMANDGNGYPYGWSGTCYYETSPAYTSLGMAYAARSDLLGMPLVAAQHFYQKPASSHGIGVKSPGHLYQFADTVIQNESQYGNSGRK